MQFFLVIGMLLGMMATAFGLMFVAAFLRGWVLSWLWFWFVVPLGGPVLGVAQAFGLALTFGMFTGQAAIVREIRKNRNDRTDEEKANDKNKILTALASPFFALFVGYIIHRFFM